MIPNDKYFNNKDGNIDFCHKSIEKIIQRNSEDSFVEKTC